MEADIRVFISHKNEDKALSAVIAARLAQNGIQSYLDTIDNEIYKDGPDLADYIRRQMDRCTQLIAVMTDKTQLSWWVPWEIGVATEKERPLASFVSGLTEMPSYLTKWPYMRTLQDLDKYSEVSKGTRRTLNESVRLRKSTIQDAQTSAFRQFHRSLKASLGQ